MHHHKGDASRKVLNLTDNRAAQFQQRGSNMVATAPPLSHYSDEGGLQAAILIRTPYPALRA